MLHAQSNGVALTRAKAPTLGVRPKTCPKKAETTAEELIEKRTAQWGSEGVPDATWKQEVIHCSPESWEKLKAGDPSLSSWNVLRFPSGIFAIAPVHLVVS